MIIEHMAHLRRVITAFMLDVRERELDAEEIREIAESAFGKYVDREYYAELKEANRDEIEYEDDTDGRYISR